MNQREKKRVTIKIMGDEYTIRGTASAQHLEKVADYVDGMMLKLANNNPHMSKHMLATLCSINLADELLRLKDEFNRKAYLQQLQIEQAQDYLQEEDRERSDQD
ncbi:MAG: cell division protein ZapA [Dethiobacteria bacterium]